MPKYTVTIKEIEIYVIEDVEAESEDDAEQQALETLTENTKAKYHNDSDGEVDAYEED